MEGVDCVPSYFVVGGLVFVRFTWPFLEHAFGAKDWRKSASLTLTALLWDFQETPGQEVVVLHQVLSHDINFGYRGLHSMRCKTFNGVEILNLEHLAELVDTCCEQYFHFGLEGGRSVVMDRMAAGEHGPQILQQHAIAFDRSPDLREVAQRAEGEHAEAGALAGMADGAATAAAALASPAE